MFGFRPIDRLKFFLERQFVKGAHYQLFAMAMAVAGLSFLGGLMVMGTDDGQSFSDAAWWAFLRLSDPGYLGDDEGIWRRVVATLLTLGGYVLVVGSVVAILTRWLISFTRRLERGLTPVTITDHIVILRWTDRTVPVVREIMQSTAKIRRFLATRGSKRQVRVAVMAEDMEPEMAHEIRTDEAIRRRSDDVILRSGSALNVNHLERVAAHRSSAIILPTQVFDGESLITSDVETIKTLLSLRKWGETAAEELPYVVAELQDARKIGVARRAYSGPMELIAGDTAIGRLIAQTIFHPGLSQVFNELLSAGSGNEFHIRIYDQFAEQPFSTAQAHLPDASVLGVLRSQGEGFIPHLNPAADFLLAPGDRFVMIGESEEQTTPQAESTPLPQLLSSDGAPPRRAGEFGTSSRQVLILGWSHKVPALLCELASYRGTETKATIVSTVAADTRRQAVDEYDADLESGDFDQIEADFTVWHELKQLNPHHYDAVVFISSDRLADGEEADARSIVGYLSLLELLDGRQDGRPQLMLELADAHNVALIGRTAAEVIITPLLLSHMLAQVAMRRELWVVLEELFTAGGAEFSFRHPEDYGLVPGQSYSWAQMRAAATDHGETLIGYNEAINPDHRQSFSVASEHQLLALSTVEK